MHKCSKEEKKGSKQQKRRVFESEQGSGQGQREARREVAKREKETGRQTKHTGIMVADDAPCVGDLWEPVASNTYSVILRGLQYT